MTIRRRPHSFLLAHSLRVMITSHITLCSQAPKWYRLHPPFSYRYKTP